MTTTQGIKLDEQTQKRIKALAAKRDRSPHWLMKTAIENYLEREEQYEREKTEDMQRWANYELTGQAIDNAEVTQWLNKLENGQNEPWQR